MMRELQTQYSGADAPSRRGYTWRAGDVAVARCSTPDQRYYRVRVLAVPEKEPERAQVRRRRVGRPCRRVVAGGVVVMGGGRGDTRQVCLEVTKVPGSSLS